jgi:hypothetical protein
VPHPAGWQDSKVADLLLWRRPLASLVAVLLAAAALAAGEFALRGGHGLTLLTGAAAKGCCGVDANADPGASCMRHGGAV